MTILGIDPGTYSSGWALYDPDARIVTESGTYENGFMEKCLESGYYRTVALEMIGHYGTGMSVGAETYHTVLWIGRWLKVCEMVGVEAVLLRRPSIKAELCGEARAKDSNVTQALRDLLGPKGTKASPGPTYGVSGHAWQALAVAVAYSRGVKPIEWKRPTTGPMPGKES